MTANSMSHSIPAFRDRLEALYFILFFLGEKLSGPVQ